MTRTATPRTPAAVDPFVPASLIDRPDRAPSHGARLAQRERRARILAAVRTLIARHGVGGVTIRDVAEISGLSVQTIYNLVGKRAQLVEAAICDHILSTARVAASLDAYPNVLLALADLMWMNAVDNQQYAREATLGSNDPELDIYDAVCRRNVRSLRRLLNRKYGGIVREKGIDLDALAINITMLVGAVGHGWARGRIDLAEFRYRLASAYGLLLLGLVPADEAARTIEWLRLLDKARRPLSGGQFTLHSSPLLGPA